MRGEALPPLTAARSPLLGGKLSRGGSRDCGVAAAAAAMPGLVPEGSDALLAVSRSALSGSSKTPFPPDRSFVNDFDWTKNSRDLPASVRPIIEDNKMLQEELRRYRQRVGEQEGTIATQDRTITALRDELQRQRAQLRECSAVSPAQLLQEQQFRRELQERDESMRQLRQKAEVVARAKTAVERRLANDLAAERRAAAALKQQMKAMQEEMAEKAKQHRFNQLHIKDLYQRLEPLEAAVAAAAQAAQQAPPPPEPAPPPEPQVVCKLMLCMVYEQPQPTAAEIAEAAARLAAQEAERRAAEQQRQHAAATRLQAAARGYLARWHLAAQHAAATTIQAAARGFLVRQALATIWEAADEAAEEAAHSADLASANLSPAQRLAQRQREAEMHYQRRAVAGKAKPQKRLPVRPGTTARGANTAVEAAARRRGLPPAGGESEHGTGAAAARRASALALLGGGSQAGGRSSSPFRRLSSLAGLGSRSLGQGSDGSLGGAGAGGAGRDDAFGQQGHTASRASWTGKAARTATSSAEGGAAGSPGGSPVRHQGRLSMAQVPWLDVAPQDVRKQQPAIQQQLAQVGGQQGDRQRQPRSQARSEEGGQHMHIQSASPSWQLERAVPPAEASVPVSGGQRSRRRESLGFGSTKPRV